MEEYGPTFLGGVQLFPGGGVQLYIPIQTYRTCDFTGGGVQTPSPPLEPRMASLTGFVHTSSWP